MTIGDYAEIGKQEWRGLCRIVAVDWPRVTVRSEHGEIVTVNYRSLAIVPGPEELRARAAAIREANMVVIEGQSPKPRIRPHSIADFSYTVRGWKSIA